ncbi:hypothetical protein [Marinomonas ostreistagni]|uniref:hypothetical protein n=1 Tax=Marinomonas ostreistagni TaxID=359209 RepID=UPI0019512B2C|nr:hypothetical protein [Marinomonas ostreistagni]MBM6549939.1 hypothetical protein [Marinomonas ostreistagni]
MTRFFITTLLAPLILLFSINATALDTSDTHGFLKTGVLETPIELPTPEVTPDPDHALPISNHVFADVNLRCSVVGEKTGKVDRLAKALSCRDPPQL